MKDDPLQSVMVKGSGRRFFFDVSEKPSGLLLTVKESRMVQEKRCIHVIHVWEDDVDEFVCALLQCLDVFASRGLLPSLESMSRGRKHDGADSSS